MTRGEVRFARFLARRFVRARHQGFISLIGLVSALGFTVGVASLVVVLALMTGFQEDFVSRIIGANAHLVIFPADGGALIETPEQAVAAVEAVPGVVAAEPVVQGFAGIVGPSGVAQWSVVTGIDPQRAAEVTDVDEQMVWGRLDALAVPGPGGRPGVILGEVLADRLGVFPGDAVRLLVPRPRLAPWGPTVRQPVLEVVGTFSTGFREYDESWAFVSLEVGQRLFDAEGAAHRLAARVADLDRVEEIEQAVQQALGEDWDVSSILEYNRAYFSALRLEKLLMSLAVGLIVVVAALGVVSTLVLTVSQKVREIGVLMALGASRRGVLMIFVLEGLMMGLLGTVLGAGSGVGLCWLLDRFELIPLDPGIYYLDHLPFRVLPADLLAVTAASVLISLVATVYPAWRAAGLDPVEALRSE
ncbi:MAG: ABC transporter permease [Acidobacteria bacterium]|nr:MAG: ABC transporter permease [Acidobacteriota bacterium]